MAVISFILGVKVLLVLAQEFLRRSPRTVFAVFGALPVVLAPYWLATSTAETFAWLKLVSVLLSICWITSHRHTRLHTCRWAPAAIELILDVNILEAVIHDITRCELSHGLNAASGALLILCRRRDAGAIVVETAGLHRDLVWKNMTMPWVIGYTAWNWVFIYLNFPEHAGHSTAVLAAPLAVGVFRPERWFLARTFTLGSALIIFFTFPAVFDHSPIATHRQDAAGELLSSALGLAYMLVYCVWFLKPIVTPRRDAVVVRTFDGTGANKLSTRGGSR